LTDRRCDCCCRTTKEKVVEESEVDWGQLKKVTVEGEEAAVVEDVVQLKKVEAEETAQMQLGPRRQSVLVRTCVLRQKMRIATERHLPYGITQCYLLPGTGERALP